MTDVADREGARGWLRVALPWCVGVGLVVAAYVIKLQLEASFEGGLAPEARIIPPVVGEVPSLFAVPWVGLKVAASVGFFAWIVATVGWIYSRYRADGSVRPKSWRWMLGALGAMVLWIAAYALM